MGKLDSNSNITSEVIIVGGGLAGLSMAAALSHLPISITILEAAKSTLVGASSKSKSEYSPSFDDRALALSKLSIDILANIGVLSDSDIQSCEAIEQIHVSDKGHLGMLRMNAAEIGEDSFGHVIPAPVLGNKLIDYILADDFSASINCVDQVKVSNVRQGQGVATVDFKQRSDERNQKTKRSHRISSKLLILADGGRSGIADSIGLPATQSVYDQVGILANVRVNKEHQNIAYERFTKNGPMALLPLRDKEYKLVWTVKPEQQQSLLDCSEQEFLKQLQNQFGYRAGQFNVLGKRVAYPMHAAVRQQIISGRVALIGNAAHSLHPIAGQGFNLGLRDVACLAGIISEYVKASASASDETKIDIGKVELLNAYQVTRKSDIYFTAGFTHQLVKIFSNSIPPVALFRNIGLIALDKYPRLKRKFMRQLVGTTANRLIESNVY